jgi:hypothetical protein
LIVPRPLPTTRRVLGPGVLIALGALALAGCTKPLLSPTDQRTPFDRYDAVRNQYATQQVEDEYGAKKPNLRARLMPKQ